MGRLGAQEADESFRSKTSRKELVRGRMNMHAVVFKDHFVNTNRRTLFISQDTPPTQAPTSADKYKYTPLQYQSIQV
jgi:hypothetical protein